MDFLRYSLLFCLAINLSISKPWINCDKSEAIKKLSLKKIDKPFDRIPSNPYHNMTPDLKKKIDLYLKDEEIVCALKYIDSERITYTLKTFPSKEEAEKNGFNVTHQGRCGVCSTISDLILYLTVNMTGPVSTCAAKAIISEKWSRNCLKNIGFTDACIDIWYYNSVNTKEDCLAICLYSKIFNIPYVDENGNLNKCLQCDEDKSGPVFKYFSGRTRRDSGIESEIARDPRKIYDIEHCYY